MNPLANLFMKLCITSLEIIQQDDDKILLVYNFTCSYNISVN